MHHDIDALRRFYYQRAMGRVVQRILRDRLTGLWPAAGCAGMTVAGFGFAAPMLRPYLAHARRVTALMPGAQGVMGWPAGAPNHSVLCEQTQWPIETGSIDRLVVLHGLETSGDADALLAEIWRVMGPGGRALFMVPNRAGLWAASDATPFGLGRAYTAGQLEAQLQRAGFTGEWQGAALYIPPSDRRFWLGNAGFWERTGARISRYVIAGVVLAEVAKHPRAPIGPAPRSLIRSPIAVLEGMARPRPAGGAALRRAGGGGDEAGRAGPGAG